MMSRLALVNDQNISGWIQHHRHTTNRGIERLHGKFDPGLLQAGDRRLEVLALQPATRPVRAGVHPFGLADREHVRTDLILHPTAVIAKQGHQPGGEAEDSFIKGAGFSEIRGRINGESDFRKFHGR